MEETAAFRLRNPQMTNQEIADALGLDSTHVKQLSGTVDACLIHVFSVVASRRGEMLTIHGKWVFNTTNLEMRQLCEAAEKFADRV